MARFKVGVQLHPQATSMEDLRAAARHADSLGVDSLWTWDHFYPLYGDADAAHFEGWTTLTAMACDTTNATVGHLVACNSYRNADLHADMARTLDHISGGRAYFGLGAGWFERDYEEYGYEFGDGPSRLKDLEVSLQRIKERLSKLNPGPVGNLPILIGGAGPKVTLRLVAQYADAWNTFGPPAHYAEKNQILNDWCAKVGRDPSQIERTVGLQTGEVGQVDEFLDAGATHMILMMGVGQDWGPLEGLLARSRD